MERTELLELMSAEGLRLLDSLDAASAERDVVATVAGLRKAGHSASLVSAVLGQAKLRAKARSKFGNFAERMLFTPAGLEQATRLPVAALHAGRFRAAGLERVVDLGCGIGGDALALAGLGISVTAVESDEITAAIAAYNLAPFPDADVRNALAHDIDASAFDGVYLDPARRTAGHQATRRLADPEDYTPPLTFAFDLAERMPAGVKLGPGYDRALIPAAAEAQWISVDGQLVETGLWFGQLAREGIRRAALVIAHGSSTELTAAADAADEPVGPLGEYLLEPDGAVIRSRLIGDLARTIGARMLSDGIAYLTADAPTLTPFASCFRIREELPYAERDLARALRSRGIGTVEIKKRGVDVDPARMRSHLKLRGAESATIVLTRVAGKHTAFLADRL